MAQRTGLKKAELQALADTNGVEYKDGTTNAELEDALEAKGVDLASAEEAPFSDDRPSVSDEVQLEGTPASPSGTKIVGEDATTMASTTPGAVAPALTMDSAPDKPQEQAAVAAPGVAAAVAPATSVTPPNVDDIDTEELLSAREVIDKVLAARNASPTSGVAEPTTMEQAKSLPFFHGHKVTLKDAAKHLRLGEDDILPNSVRVRQLTDNQGEPYGDAYVTAVDVNGGKHAKKL